MMPDQTTRDSVGGTSPSQVPQDQNDDPGALVASELAEAEGTDRTEWRRRQAEVLREIALASASSLRATQRQRALTGALVQIVGAAVLGIAFFVQVAYVQTLSEVEFGIAFIVLLLGGPWAARGAGSTEAAARGVETATNRLADLNDAREEKALLDARQQDEAPGDLA